MILDVFAEPTCGLDRHRAVMGREPLTHRLVLQVVHRAAVAVRNERLSWL